MASTWNKDGSHLVHTGPRCGSHGVPQAHAEAAPVPRDMNSTLAFSKVWASEALLLLRISPAYGCDLAALDNVVRDQLAISARTKAVPQAAKARGRLGGDRGAPPPSRPRKWKR